MRLTIAVYVDEEYVCGGKTFPRIFHVANEWRERGCRLELFMREYMGRNGSAQNSSKTSCKRGTYTYLRGTVPISNISYFCVNAA